MAQGCSKTCQKGRSRDGEPGEGLGSMDPTDACPIHGMHREYVNPKLVERRAARMKAEAASLTDAAERTLAKMQQQGATPPSKDEK